MSTIDRGPFNALVDDDGSNLIGTVWNKAAIAGVLLDPVDRLPDTVITSTLTGGIHNWAPGLLGHTVIYWTGATDLMITGFAGGVPGQRVTVKNRGAGVVWFTYYDTGSAAANRFVHVAQSAPMPIAGEGFATYEYVGGVWCLLGADQGRWFAPAFAASNFTGSESLVWTVDAADMRTYKARLTGSTLVVDFTIADFDVSGTGLSLIMRIPGGFTAKSQIFGPLMYADAGGPNTWGYWLALAGANTLLCRKMSGNWTPTTADNSSIFGFAQFEVN